MTARAENLAPASSEEFSARLFDASAKATDLLTVYLGSRLGLYSALAESGPATAPALARRLGLNERHTREWLEQQAVAGILSVDSATLPASERSFGLPPEHAASLIDPDSPFSTYPLVKAVVAIAKVVDRIADAFKSGNGIAWADYGLEMLEAQGDFNRPWLMGQLTDEYLAAIPDIHARLQGPAPARVLDVGCGFGWSSIAIARAYPNVSVRGVDPDTASIAAATENAAARGLSDRVKFEVRDAAGLTAEEAFDFALIVEAVHDMSNPVEVLSAVRKALKPGAGLLVIDEKVQDSFAAPGDDIERLMYAVSVLLCLPAAMADTPSAATGTVMRASTLERYAREAGFQEFEVLDVEHPILRFYLLRQ